MEQPLAKGSFLIASPEMSEGFYSRAVIVLCEHTSGGSFGIMVNKALPLGEVPEDILDVSELPNPDKIQLRAGGALQPHQLMLLHTSNGIPDHTLEVTPGLFLGGDLHFLQQAAYASDGPQMRLCFGFSGWGAGQLEKELRQGHWFHCPASAKHVFETSPDKLWQILLREMGGKYATLSMIPEDLSLN